MRTHGWVFDTLPAIEFVTRANQQLAPGKSPITVQHDRAAKAQVGARLRLARGETAVCPRIVRPTDPHSWISHNGIAART